MARFSLSSNAFLACTTLLEDDEPLVEVDAANFCFASTVGSAICRDSVVMIVDCDIIRISFSAS